MFSCVEKHSEMTKWKEHKIETVGNMFYASYQDSELKIETTWLIL